MKKSIVYLLAYLPFIIHAQNVGIGTPVPTGPLSFASILGNKMVLWGDGNNPHYGIGVQSGMLQLYADVPNTNIVFGSGRSGVFNERMRIINSGEEGLILKGRVLLQNGTSNPVDPAYAAGIWLFKPDNSGTMGFIGVQNSQNIGFYGGPNAWGLTYNTVNSRVGIGNNNPNAPLAFSATLGKKITFFPGTLGDAGIGMAGNRLQIYSDNPNADVAIGYDAAGTFNERFAFKPSGALAVGGNTGLAGQVLISNGNAASPSWLAIPKPKVVTYNQSSNTTIGGGLEKEINGLNGGFILDVASTVVFTGNMNIVSSNAVLTSYGWAELRIIQGTSTVVATARSTGAMDPLRKVTLNPTGSVELPAGIYTIKGFFGRLNAPDLPNLSFSETPSQVIVQIFPN